MCLKTLVRLRGLRGPFVLVPSAAYDPLAGLRFGNGGFHTIHQFFVALYVGEIKIEFVVTKTHNVAVTFNETRRHGLALQVDDLRIVAFVFHSFVTTAGKDYFCSRHDNRLNFWLS